LLKEDGDVQKTNTADEKPQAHEDSTCAGRDKVPTGWLTEDDDVSYQKRDTEDNQNEWSPEHRSSPFMEKQGFSEIAEPAHSGQDSRTDWERTN